MGALNKGLSKVVNFLLSFWGVVIIFMIVAAVVFWFTAPLIGPEDSPPLAGAAIRLAVIVAMLALWLVGVLVVTLFNKRGAPPEENVETSEEAARRRAEEDLRTNRSALIQGFDRQMTILRDHLPGKRSGRYAYHLPWYLVLGMRASGKSTLLVSSGQEYPLAHLLDTDPLAPVVPTEDLSCWVTNEAVFIDTPGSLFASDGARTETDRMRWDTLTHLLTHYRGRRPVNGVVMVISLEDLITKSDHERALDAQIMRRRILELMERLGVKSQEVAHSV